MIRYFSDKSHAARRRRGFLSAGCLLLSLMSSGCSREFWRSQADRDSYEVTSEKITDERWAVPKIDIEPDPRSRFFDPYDPNYEPLPPDDTAANALMHEVAGKKGYKSWHKFGEAFSVENPQWMEQLVANAGEEDVVLHSSSQGTVAQRAALTDLSLAELIELSYIHDREYQSAIEDVYLRALTVTLQRFQFGVRYLGNRGVPGVDVIGVSEPGAGGENSVGASSNFGVSQLLPSGAQWVMELTNNTLWVFSGGNSSTASTISWSLTQPLLRGAGRKVVLEALTQAERELLYSLRDLARFRKIFFSEVVAGGGSYLSLLLQQRQITNQVDNIKRLERQVEVLQELSSFIPSRTLVQLPALPAGVTLPVPGTPSDDPAWQAVPEPLRGKLTYDPEATNLIWRGEMTNETADLARKMNADPAWVSAVNEIAQNRLTQTFSLEVSQLLSRLTNQQQRLRQIERGLQDTYDSFKISLGLPPDLKFSIDTSLLKQFELIAPEVLALEDEVFEYILRWSTLDPAEENDEPQPTVDDFRARLMELRALAQKVKSIAADGVAGDKAHLSGMRAEREASLTSDEDRERFAADVRRDDGIFENTVSELATETRRLDELLARLDSEPLTDALRKDIFQAGETIWSDLLKFTQSFEVLQVGYRVESVLLQPFDLSLEQVTQLALENRLDLMNQRADVMDARRRVEVAANELEAVMSLTAQGNISTFGDSDNPVDFRGDNSSYQLGLQFDTPFDQLDERNIYRRALIDYQRARRLYMQTEDRVKEDVRQAFRQLQVLRQNFEISRQSVRFAAIELDITIEQSNDPANQGQNRGLNLLNALQSVLDAQDQFIDTWVQYEQNRINIYRDMDIMEIDERGIWIDSYYQKLTGSRENLIPEPQQIPTNPPPAPGFDESSGIDRKPMDGIARYDVKDVRAVAEPASLIEIPFETPTVGNGPTILPRKPVPSAPTDPPRNGRPGAEISVPVLTGPQPGEDSRNEPPKLDPAQHAPDDWKLPVIRTGARNAGN